MQNMSIQIQNLKVLSFLENGFDSTIAQIVLVSVGMLLATGLMLWGLKKIFANF